jgi:hypothetical protein
MIIYSVYIVITMLQLVLGHPMSLSNNQDVAIISLLPREYCFPVLNTRIIYDTPLPLNIHVPNSNLYIERLPFQLVEGSTSLEYVSYRSDVPSSNQMTRHVHVRNEGTYIRDVRVYSLLDRV